jgi:hypothetical protein
MSRATPPRSLIHALKYFRISFPICIAHNQTLRSNISANSKRDSKIFQCMNQWPKGYRLIKQKQRKKISLHGPFNRGKISVQYLTYCILEYLVNLLFLTLSSASMLLFFSGNVPLNLYSSKMLSTFLISKEPTLNKYCTAH